VTFLHYVEHVADIRGKRIARYQVPVREDGRRVWRAMEEFDTSGDGVHSHWPDRFFAKIVDTFLASTRNKAAKVGNAAAYRLSARELFNFALAIMKAVAADPSAAKSLTERSIHGSGSLAIRRLTINGLLRKQRVGEALASVLGAQALLFIRGKLHSRAFAAAAVSLCHLRFS
jgi:hypothetical protein